ncbi:MAG: 2-oxo acid dehydrogenase subunit E2, partial [Anaerolineae bacterium]|nr:2-oxo acid dehydrogenase subunit E2 [Anaerolineae bacterium]
EVKAGEAVVVVMSKKITYEVEAPAEGILRHVAKPKDVRGIGEVIGWVTQPGEEIPEEEIEAPSPEEAPSEEAAEAPEPPAPEAKEAKKEAPAEEERVPSSPAARRLAKELGVDISKVTPTGRRISEDDVMRYHDEQSRIVASPLARRMAEEEGLDLAEIQGTGPGGRITEEDILHILEEGEVPAAPPRERIPFVGMRQAIAEQMVDSLQTMAQVAMATTADVTELRSTREALGVRWGRKPSYTDLLVRAVVLALKEHPMLGARLEGDEIVLPTEYNVGVAVALEDGLIVPVVRKADELNLLEIGDRVKDLAQRARENNLNVDEVTGGAITITNLGTFGIDAFTPIINPPEVAILGVGRIVQELALVEGQVVARDKMTLSLTVDHRIVDGAPGAQFLQTLVQFLEHPALLFAHREA